MKLRLALIATLILSLGGFSLNASAATHPTYALGKAPACAIDYHKSTLTHVVKRHGKRIRVRYVACVYHAPVIVTTTTVPPTTTTTLADPPTVIAITPSESPAIVGDVITYSMTIVDVLTPTLGAVYMTDDGITLTGCVGPTATNQGTLTYSCSETYASTDVGSHQIAGIFLGDAIYAQSAGQLVEPVLLTAPPTTTTTVLNTTTYSAPAPTTTTTLAPTPTTTTTTLPPLTVVVSCNSLTEGYPSTAPTGWGVVASVTGSDGTTPVGDYTFAISPSASIQATGSGGIYQYFHFTSAGNYTVTATFTGSRGAYAGISGSGTCSIVIS